MEAQVEAVLSLLNRDAATEPSPLVSAISFADLGDIIALVPRKKHAFLAASIVKHINVLGLNDKTSSLLDVDGEIRAACTLISLFLRDKKSPTPPDLLLATRSLHDALPRLVSQTSRNAVVRLCETFWADYRDGRETIIDHALAALLEKSLAEGTVPEQPGMHNRMKHSNGPAVSDVKRVYALREAILAEAANEGQVLSQRTRALLLRAVTAAVYLRTGEGQRFLAHLLASGFPNVHPTMLRMLPNVRKSRATAIGSVYVHAWKSMDIDDFTPILEDLLTKATLASTEPLATNLRSVLSGFHSNKRVSGMDETLHIVYTPILFRSLTVANPLVRKNATIILADSFPVHDPSMPLEELERSLDQQCSKFVMLLEDPVPLVRVSAIEGVCRIMGLLWEIVPQVTARRIVDIMSGTLAFDKTSAHVRAAVCDGFVFMLENHLTHPLLSVALKRLSNMVHDKVERVRVAFLDLLLALKEKRIVSARYFDIVRLPDLLYHIAVDPPTVCIRIMKLLVSSYFPLERKNKSKEQIAASQVRACLEIMKENPAACRAFYSQVHMHAPPGALIEFCIRVASLAMSSETDRPPTPGEERVGRRRLRSPRKTRRSRSGFPEVPSKENVAPPGTVSQARDDAKSESAESDSRREQLLDVVSMVMHSLRLSLAKPSNADILKVASDIFGGASLKALVLERGNSRVTRIAALRIASSLPPNDISPVVAVWRNELGALLDLCRTQHVDSNFGQWVQELVHFGLCAGLENDIAEAMSGWSDVAYAGHRALELGSKVAKRARRASADINDSCHQTRVEAASAISCVSDALVLQRENREMFVDGICNSLRSESDDAFIENGSEFGSNIQIVIHARRGVLVSIEEFLECPEEYHENTSMQLELLRNLKSSMGLATLGCLAVRTCQNEGSIEGVATRAMGVISILEFVQWGLGKQLLSKSFAFSTEFGLALTSVIVTLATDAAGLGLIEGQHIAHVTLLLSHIRPLLSDEAVELAPSIISAVLRLAAGGVSIAYHVVNADFDMEDLPEPSGVGETTERNVDELHDVIKASFELLASVPFESDADELREEFVALQSRFLEFILAYSNGKHVESRVNALLTALQPNLIEALSSHLASEVSRNLAARVFCSAIVQCAVQRRHGARDDFGVFLFDAFYSILAAAPNDGAARFVASVAQEIDALQHEPPAPELLLLARAVFEKKQRVLGFVEDNPAVMKSLCRLLDNLPVALDGEEIKPVSTKSALSNGFPLTQATKM